MLLFLRTHAARRCAAASARALFVIALSEWPVSTAGAQSMNTTVKPGDDFFAYANDAWLKATAIPAGKDRWGARDEINEHTRQQLAALLDDARSQPRGSLARKVADFRSAWLDDATIEARGRAPLAPPLHSIDRIQDRAALARALGHAMRADVDPLNWGIYRSAHPLGLSIEESIHGEKRYVAFLVQGGLGLPDRADYLDTAPPALALRGKYREYVVQMLTLAGVDAPGQRADAVLSLEVAIARSQATREASANDRNADNVWTRADFNRRAPGMDWDEFFAAAGLAAQDTFVAWQPSAVTGLAALVASQPLEAWKDYLRFHAVDDMADVLPRAFVEQAAAMRAAAAGRPIPLGTRAERALNATQSAMSDAIGRIYVERYFPADQKRRVQAIAANVTAAFIKRVDASTWMSPATKALALAKLKTLYVGIGYPDQWTDFTDLVIDPKDAAGNLARVAERHYRSALARLGKPIDRTEWWMAPQSAGALLVFQLDSYVFSAALLQPPKFDASASEAASYGAIGAIIGHDVSHFVDVLGAEYDVDGRMRHWWTQNDSARFQTLAQPLVRQFSSYRPFPDVSINGTLTQSENIADLAGLTAAFDAYRSTLAGRLRDSASVRQHDREFFIAFAQSYRTRISESAMRAQVATNDHAPEMYRVATVRNLDAWYEAFDVRPGQRLYVAPAARVRIW